MVFKINPFTSDRAKIESILGNTFERKPVNLYFHKWQPNSDLVFNYCYFKATITHEEYTKMLKNSKWHTVASKGDALLYLPSDWKLQPDLTLDWWDESSNTPPDAAVKIESDREWVIVKFENGFLYGIYTKN